MSGTVLWLDNDFRVTDQPALAAACERGGPVIPVFIDDAALAPRLGGAARWWLHHSLTALDADLRRRGSRLLVRRGPTARVLEELIRETSSSAVAWTRRYEPSSVQIRMKLKEGLTAQGVEVCTVRGNLLFEPWEVQTKQGRPFQVFTPFWKACLARDAPPSPLPAPPEIPAPPEWPVSLSLEELRLLPKIPWDKGFSNAWTPGEAGARRRMSEFLSRIPEYSTERDRPDRDGVSRLSPHLHFGELSPRQVWAAVLREFPLEAPKPSGPGTFRAELGWREFAHHVLFQFPQTASAPLRSEFASFPWRDDLAGLQAWTQGRTGFPIIDAGMRQLWTTGWMHNRVRMLVGSFLTKDLLISWKQGADWFWDTLVDADLASNTLGWQWVAGCGADAAPFYRIFNPVLQGQKFDPKGDYVRRWVPELARLPAEVIHEPWAAEEAVLSAAGVRLGTTYPRPIVDHRSARERALALHKAAASARGVGESDDDDA